jgi:chitinase
MSNYSSFCHYYFCTATTINPDNLEKGYDMLAMYPHIDFFNMMSYDIHGSWDKFAGSNSDMEYICNTFDYIFELGVPPEKLVLGLAAYGRSSALSNPKCTTDGCPIAGAGLYGCHGEGGNLPYFEIDSLYAQPGGHDSMIFNAKTGSMEIVSGNNFLSFDNAETFNIKYRYAFENCLRGIMWYVSRVKCDMSNLLFV